MGNFRQENSRGKFGNKSSSSRFGGRSGEFGERGKFGRGRDSERRPLEMHDATCSKCGKRCQVPFRPTGSKPVFCSDCFRQNEGSGSNFGPRNQDRLSQSEVSSEQFNQINAKLDRILRVIENLEIDIGDESGEDFTEEDEDLEEKMDEKDSDDK